MSVPDLFIQKPVHLEIDLSNARRVFTFGDIHGNLAPLKQAMKEARYDASAGDRMIGLGDWLDRGSDTLKIAKFIEKHADDLCFVKGNHEELLEDAVRPREGGRHPADLIRNGGSWIIDHLPESDEDEEERDEKGQLVLDADGQRIVRSVCGAPIAITVKTPGNRKIGFVHGEALRIMNILDWDIFTGVLEQQGPYGYIAEGAMWERDEFLRIRSDHASGKKLKMRDMVQNVDHVFHGHTINKAPITWGNRSWIDIASYKRGEAIFADVDKWTRKHSQSPSRKD